MDDIIERFLSQEFTKKTEKYYRSLLMRFEHYLKNNNKNIHNFEIMDVQNYYKNKMERNEWTTPDSINTFIIVLQRFCRWIIEETESMMIGKQGTELDDILRERVRLTKIIRMKKPKLLQKIKTERPVFLQDIKKKYLIMLKDKHDDNHYNFMRSWCLDWFGCRVGELVAIKPNMINLDDNSIFFNTEKTLIQRMNYYDDFTKKIIELYLRDNRLLNITEQAMWWCINKYSKEFGKNLDTKLGRQSFNTNMSSLKDDDKLKKYLKKKYSRKYGRIVSIDSNFVKIISGHTIKGLKDISQVYKIYPLEMIKEIMVNYHYLIPLEKEISKVLW